MRTESAPRIDLCRLLYNLCKSFARTLRQQFPVNLLPTVRESLSRSQMIEGCPHTVYICPLVNLRMPGKGLRGLAAQNHDILFRGRITVCISEDRTVIQIEGNIKINQTDIAFRRQHDIRRFDIAVYDRRFLIMQIIQGTAYLHAPADKLFLCEMLPLIQQLGKRFAGDVAHYRIHIPVHFKEIQNLREIGMMKIFQNIHFLTVYRPGYAPILHLFQNHRLPQPPVVCFIDNSSGAFSKTLQYLIRTGKLFLSTHITSPP